MLIRDRDLAPPRKKGISRQQALIGAVGGLALGFLSRFAIHAWLVFPFSPQSAAMAPALPAGHRVYVWRNFDRNELQRGTIVLYRHPQQSDRFLIGRIIGLPGEQVQLHERRVYINNQLLGQAIAAPWEAAAERNALYREPPDPENSAHRDFFPPRILKENEVFVLGDNRPEAFDSRILGPIDRQLLDGVIHADQAPNQVFATSR
ncbi:MAG: signal peptidase I [Leptospirales bacterium]|nr:signal peptidase I [Leptospirales bacterium]